MSLWDIAKGHDIDDLSSELLSESIPFGFEFVGAVNRASVSIEMDCDQFPPLNQMGEECKEQEAMQTSLFEYVNNGSSEDRIFDSITLNDSMEEAEGEAKVNLNKVVGELINGLKNKSKKIKPSRIK